MRWLAPTLVALSLAAPASARAATLGFDRGDRVCRATIAGFRLAWTETAFSRNQVQGADGACRTVPAYVGRIGRVLRGVDRTAGLAGLTHPAGQAITVLDVRGPTGYYAFTTGRADGTSAIALDIYLDPSDLRPSIARQIGYAIENAAVPDVFHRLPPWVVQGLAGWFELVAAPRAAVAIGQDLAVLGGVGTSTPVTGLGRPATAFFTLATGGLAGAPTIRTLLRRAGRRDGQATTRLLVGDLTVALGAATLATAMGSYAVALEEGVEIGGIPLPSGFQAGTRRVIALAGTGEYGIRTTPLEPLGVAFVPVTWPSGAGQVTLQVDAPDVRTARSLVRSCSLLLPSGGLEAGVRVGREVSWRIAAESGSATLALASSLPQRVVLHLRAVAQPPL